MTDTPQLGDWIAAFDRALSYRDVSGVADLFHDECYWRDLLAFTWNIKTMEGRPEIVEMLSETLSHVAPRAWRVSGQAEIAGNTVSSWITFETAAGVCKGRLTLVDGKCHILMTALDDLHGHEEPRGRTRNKGLTHRADPHRRTWSELRHEETRRMGHEDQPYVLIVGGGQGGIALGARLRQLGVPALIVEKNARAGDSWRNRYRSLVLHDPVWYDHLPYLEFPENWPVFTPKDKLGDWLEAYANIFELEIWQSTSCDKASFDAENGLWTVEVTRDGKPVTLRPAQLVFATGAYGPPREIDIPGGEEFAGTLIHSSAYQSGEAFAGKTCAVIGAASSAHDVCVDLWEAGADVTMLQRSPSIVVRSETLMDLGFEIYSEDAVARGITVDVADMLAASVPFALFPDQQRALYQDIRKRDAAFYDRLAAAGFDFDFGEDDSGLMMKALRTASGYYIDVGASDLIANGEIKVISGADVVALTPDGLRLGDGQEVTADVVVACIGYQSMNEIVAGIVSPEVASAIGPCWGLGSGVRGDPGPWQGELRNMWKPTVAENLWFHGGNLALSRFYSRFLALQLKARMEGIKTPVYRRPDPVQSGL
ncbi:NAD(P)/FAD-dependent oxidoreductase [Sedimentitalea todarodis]|uniref:NAD(P)/FAD-dependent oxidoreductase n=1 Tax=Sedimentitalea todarodis TaxID=1631240 RepID=A0ABU3VJT3_9RHOB|nr:NAD(P)/FAD-dependent oxidoreductase [Sedimentitalea todarodis]MDU9006358.1 NAD(P)/FAD-dependent oxidoreductase [Sedimentitalea todarodis]